MSSAHAIREIMILRREALYKFIRLYLEFRNKEALAQDAQVDEALGIQQDAATGKKVSAKERLDMKPVFGAGDLPDEIADEIVILFDAYAQIGAENMAPVDAENTDGEYDRPWLMPEQQSVFLGDLMKIIKRLK